ncbi:pre-mRNA-splicing factor syf2 [Patella vulgata]|uniref:pre-mRNA-splicing factor syf2 n=1 Tax=Patella vulgata TaxID=6465 RepID=UPI00217F2D96|nr:pre-mRNA-splicing factor syf2 [Patella vulgata]
MASADVAAGPSTSKPSAKDRMNRLRELELRMNEARKLNHVEVVAEDERKKRPANFEAKRKRTEWEDEQEKLREDCTKRGEDFDRVKVLDQGADDVERWEKKKKKKNPDIGFSDYEQATHRQYSGLAKKLKPDMKEYGRQKEKLGEDFYASSNTLGLHQQKSSDDAINRMVDDLEKQIDKRTKYSRRRQFDDEADIDYINERNMKFNKKLERFYGDYTSEIKQNLERGTAV